MIGLDLFLFIKIKIVDIFLPQNFGFPCQQDSSALEDDIPKELQSYRRWFWQSERWKKSRINKKKSTIYSRGGFFGKLCIEGVLVVVKMCIRGILFQGFIAVLTIFLKMVVFNLFVHLWFGQKHNFQIYKFHETVWQKLSNKHYLIEPR